MAIIKVQTDFGIEIWDCNKVFVQLISYDSKNTFMSNVLKDARPNELMKYYEDGWRCI
jgi:hypothetical protein